MTTYTIQDLERLVTMAGQGERHVSPRFPSGNVSMPDFRVDIRRDIYQAVLVAGRGVTRAEIAKAVCRKKSRWLNERIEDLVRDGLLHRTHGFWKNGVVMYYYEVA
jgi:hypothetical protein